MAGVVKLPSGKLRGWYMDSEGQQRFLKASDLKEKDVRQEAESRERKERLIRSGDIPRPKPSDKPRLICEVIEEYLAWGSSQGGHGGRPWSTDHTRHQVSRLRYWQQRLNVNYIADISLPQVENALQELQHKGRVSEGWRNRKVNARPLRGKTLQEYAATLKSLCVWAKSRNYLAVDPLEELAEFDTTPGFVRRAITADEINRILDAATRTEDRLLFEVAICTGYRRGELRALRVRNLDVNGCTLPLAAEFCKGRKDSRQPIPRALAAKLKASCEGKPEDAPLLLVKDKPHERLYIAMARCKPPIQRMGPGGKVDLHALRSAYTTLAMEAGANVKELQELARHSTAELTMKVYAKARTPRLHALVEKISESILPAQREEHKSAVGVESIISHDKIYAQSMHENSETGNSTYEKQEYPQGDLNPRPQAENLMSWAGLDDGDPERYSEASYLSFRGAAISNPARRWALHTQGHAPTRIY